MHVQHAHFRRVSGMSESDRVGHVAGLHDHTIRGQPRYRIAACIFNRLRSAIADRITDRRERRFLCTVGSSKSVVVLSGVFTGNIEIAVGVPE